LGTHEAILRLAAKEAKEKMSLPYPPPYQDLATLSQHICAAESTIENWVRIGIFPQPRKVGVEKWAIVRDLLPYPITTGTEA
jgi:hypothetical protein